jgi:hypothetical protein
MINILLKVGLQPNKTVRQVDRESKLNEYYSKTPTNEGDDFVAIIQ